MEKVLFNVHCCFRLVIYLLCLILSINNQSFNNDFRFLLGTAPTVRIEPKVITLKEGQRMIVEYTVNVS